VKGEVSFPGLEPELREIVREEIARALEIGGAGGYLSTKGAAAYLDCTEQAIDGSGEARGAEAGEAIPSSLYSRATGSVGAGRGWAGIVKGSGPLSLSTRQWAGTALTAPPRPPEV
jgi:hypothetical protein